MELDITLWRVIKVGVSGKLTSTGHRAAAFLKCIRRGETQGTDRKGATGAGGFINVEMERRCDVES